MKHDEDSIDTSIHTGIAEEINAAGSNHVKGDWL
jgi:hypothetical protein